MTFKLITAPTALPVSVDEAKSHCRITHNAEDTLIESLISTACLTCEHIIGRALMPQTWELVLDAFPVNNDIELMYPPVQSIVSVKYMDALTSTETTLATNQYSLDSDSEPGWIMPAIGVTWPATLDVANAVRIRFIAGYADATKVPKNIKHWILLTVANYYANRESFVTGSNVQDLKSNFYDGLLDRERVWRL